MPDWQTFGTVTRIMSTRYAILAGLPRSGSTVLASLLSQNPVIYASPNSPLVELLVNVYRHLHTTEQARAYLERQQITDVLRHIVTGFYEFADRPVVIDKSRAWPHPHNLSLLDMATDGPVVCIAMVRSIPAIVSSFVRQVHAASSHHNYIDKALRQAGHPLTDAARVEWLLSPGGTVFESWQTLSFGFASPWRSHLHFIEYDDLVQFPERTLERIYQLLDLPLYSHDLTAIHNATPENDAIYGIPGLHQVRPQLAATAPPPESVLTPELLERCEALPAFWRTAPRTRSNPLHVFTTGTT